MIDDTALGQFITAVFLPYVPSLSGAMIALIFVLLFISYFRSVFKKGES